MVCGPDWFVNGLRYTPSLPDRGLCGECAAELLRRAIPEINAELHSKGIPDAEHCALYLIVTNKWIVGDLLAGPLITREFARYSPEWMHDSDYRTSTALLRWMSPESATRFPWTEYASRAPTFRELVSNRREYVRVVVRSGYVEGWVIPEGSLSHDVRYFIVSSNGGSALLRHDGSLDFYYGTESSSLERVLQVLRDGRVDAEIYAHDRAIHVSRWILDRLGVWPSIVS